MKFGRSLKSWFANSLFGVLGCLALLAYIAVAPEAALASPPFQTQHTGILGKAEGAILSLLSFLQTLASLGCTAAVIRAGMRFTKVNEYENAIDQLKSTLIACAIVFSAVGLVQYIKTNINGS
jgi:hypothetical protein